MCDALALKGVVVVVAAGNEGPKEGTIQSPGTSKNAITVGAIDKHMKITFYSSRGPVNGIIKPDLVAPGGLLIDQEGNRLSPEEGIISVRSPLSDYSEFPDSCHTSLAGTSMATPHVSGAAAILIEAINKWIGWRGDMHFAVKGILKRAAKDLGYKPTVQGAGLVNIGKALEKLSTEQVERVEVSGVSDTLSDLMSVIVPSLAIGASSVVMGALLESLKKEPKRGLQELYAYVDKVLDSIMERIQWLKASYASGLITWEQYSSEMSRINSLLLSLNELIKRFE